MSRVSLARRAHPLILLGAAITWMLASPGLHACDNQADPLGPRYQVQFFEYGGAAEGEARNQNSRFRGLMSDKVIAWGEELQSGSFTHYGLPGLELRDAGADTLTSPAALKEFWNRTHSLEVFTGILEPGTRAFTVQSRIFLGELGDPLQHDSIVVSMPITGAEMASTIDAHSIVTYFALAMDLKRRRCDSSLVVAVLNRVQEKFTDLRRRGPIDQRLIPVDQAVARQLDEMRRRAP